MKNSSVALKCYLIVSVLSCSLAEYAAAQERAKQIVRPQAVVRLKATLDTGSVETFAFSPVGRLMALGYRNRTVQIWDVANGKLRHTLTGFGKPPQMFWSPGGQLLLISGRDGSAVWDARTGEKLRELAGSRHQIDDAKWSPDGSTIMLITREYGWLDNDKTEAHLCDAETGRLKFSLRIKGLSADAIFSPDGRWILTTGDQEGAKLWDGVAGGRLQATLFPTRRSFRTGASGEFSPDGRLMALDHRGFGIYLWEAATGKLQVKVVEPDGANVYSLRGFSPDGKLLVVYREHSRGLRTESSIELRDGVTGELRAALRGMNMRGSAHQVVWSPDGRTLVTAGGNEKYEGKIWDVAKGQLRATFPMVAEETSTPFTNGYNDLDHLSFHPTLPILLAVNGRFTRLWDMDNGELLQTLENSGITAQWSTDGRRLVTLAPDRKSVHLWELFKS